MINKRGKELLDQLREAVPEPAPPLEPHRDVFTERDTYRRVLERIDHILAHGLTADRKPMSAAQKLAAVTKLVDDALDGVSGGT